MHSTSLPHSQATSVLDSPAACRDGVAVGNAGHVLSALALKYGREESVAAGLVELISTREHSPGPVADLLRDSVAKWGSASLVRVGQGEAGEPGWRVLGFAQQAGPDLWSLDARLTGSGFGTPIARTP